MNDYDDTSDTLESFAKRKDRRRPTGKRSVGELYSDDDSNRNKFSDDSLQALYERGYITDVLGELKSGKEATVYTVSTPVGLAAAKVYSDMAVRSFKDDQIYRQGRVIADGRIKKAIERRSKTGLEAQQALWIFHEYSELWELYNAGIPVPKPLVGPGADDMAQAGRVVLMDYIGAEDEPAPRLADVRLSTEEAQDAWQQSMDIMLALLKMGRVHGDFSTFNLLWWNQEVIVIDLPQMVKIEENHAAAEILEQDVNSLCKSFKKHGIQEEPQLVLYDIRKAAGLIAQGPFLIR